jgi:hypothetical protein
MAFREDLPVKQYSDSSKDHEMPPYLVDPDFYFRAPIEVPDALLEAVSDSEQVAMESAEETRGKLERHTRLKLEQLLKQVDETNQTLLNMQERLTYNAEKTVDFLQQINILPPQDLEDSMPKIENMMDSLVTADRT